MMPLDRTNLIALIHGESNVVIHESLAREVFLDSRHEVHRFFPVVGAGSSDKCKVGQIILADVDKVLGFWRRFTKEYAAFGFNFGYQRWYIPIRIPGLNMTLEYKIHIKEGHSYKCAHWCACMY